MQVIAGAVWWRRHLQHQHQQQQQQQSCRSRRAVVSSVHLDCTAGNWISDVIAALINAASTRETDIAEPRRRSAGRPAASVLLAPLIARYLRASHTYTRQHNCAY